MSVKIEASVKGGRRIWSNCYIVAHSTRGAMLYTPSERATRNFIRVAERDAQKLFGEKPAILVPPRISYDDEDRPHLPPIRLVGEFYSNPLHEDSDLSTAVVIWYQQSTYPFIEPEIAVDFAQIDWEANATDAQIL